MECQREYETQFLFCLFIISRIKFNNVTKSKINMIIAWAKSGSNCHNVFHLNACTTTTKTSNNKTRNVCVCLGVCIAGNIFDFTVNRISFEFLLWKRCALFSIWLFTLVQDLLCMCAICSTLKRHLINKRTLVVCTQTWYNGEANVPSRFDSIHKRKNWRKWITIKVFNSMDSSDNMHK